MVFVSGEGDLVGDVGVETGAGLSCNKLLMDRGQVIPPMEPGFGKLLLTYTEGGFFSNECSMSVDVSE